jgi:hypothetical protein
MKAEEAVFSVDSAGRRLYHLIRAFSEAELKEKQLYTKSSSFYLDRRPL